MLPTDAIAKDPFRFSISDKKSSDNGASTFLDLPKSLLAAPEPWRRPRRWRCATLAIAIENCCARAALLMQRVHRLDSDHTRNRHIYARDHPIKVRSMDPGSQRSHPILRRFSMDSQMPFCYKGYIP
jgi:hypothetical protein